MYLWNNNTKTTATKLMYLSTKVLESTKLFCWKKLRFIAQNLLYDMWSGCPYIRSYNPNYCCYWQFALNMWVCNICTVYMRDGKRFFYTKWFIHQTGYRHFRFEMHPGKELNMAESQRKTKGLNIVGWGSNDCLVLVVDFLMRKCSNLN